MTHSNNLIPVFKTPNFERITLNNNFDIYLIPSEFSELVNIRFFANIGIANEIKKGQGNITSRLLITGNRKQSFNEIFEEVDFMGANLSPAITSDNLFLSFFAPKKFALRGLEIISECIQYPSFDKVELEKEKKRCESEILLDLSDTSTVTQQILMFNYFKGHPYGTPRKGKIKDIKDLNREDCESFHKMILQSKKSLFIAGNFNSEEIIEHIKLHFNFENEITLEMKSEFVANEKTQIFVTHKEKLGQANLRIGKSATNHKDINYPALQVSNVLFGGYFMSRLNNILREEKGYTYGIASFINIMKQANILIIASTLKENSVGDSIQTIINQMEILSNEMVDDEELNRSKQYTLGSFLRSSETIQQQSNIISNLVNFNLGYDYYDNYIKTISTLTLDDLFSAQIKYFKTDKLTMSIIGDKNIILPQLEKYSNVYLCDEYGENLEKVNI